MNANIEDFARLDLRIGTILSAEKMPDSDKLIKLSVDFGEARREIIAGIALSYPEPETLVGRQATFIFNLEPRKLRGEMSEGMILAGSDPDGLPYILSPDKELPPGTKIK